MLTNDMLNLMRRIGDPRVDSAVAQRTVAQRLDDRTKFMTDASTEHGLAPFLEKGRLDPYAVAYGLRDVLHHGDTTLPDHGLVKTACDLFARYGSEIAAALLLAALPEAYAAGEGAKVLVERSELIKGTALSTRRILATAQFVIWVLTPGTPAPPVNVDTKRRSTRNDIENDEGHVHVPELRRHRTTVGRVDGPGALRLAGLADHAFPHSNHNEPSGDQDPGVG